ncbi:methyltransferase [Micromonospora sagamiensis]|uniref:Methyltransferase family protein n=1 Tax=Micromonospora sagamiensis TaxID=47875 RepID=A0A562WI16_9ACTN|nr:methyltransferase [Micromonospora sagamiensis]TWJ29671.1 methyltransferase family protein [Micromonospora sagamiensis]BCL17298.1 SAM-dependent methyltransferase [Micromonospora sagamiensis]
MPVPLSPDEAHLFLESDAAPAAYLDLLDAVSFRSAAAGLRLGVFEALADGPLPVDRLATRTGTDPLGLRILLDALAGFGYLTRADGQYANSANAARWLLRDTPGSFAPALSFWSTVLTGWWQDLESSIRVGGPTGDFYAWLEKQPEALADFHTMLRGLADVLGPEIVELVPLPPGARSLLDVGGGHAAYPVAFLTAHPQLRATVVDLDGALAQGARTVAAAGLGDRVTLRPGDLFEADFGTGHDLVLLFNIVHGYQRDAVRTLLRRSAAALRPGGQVVLLEPLAEVPDRPAGPGEAFVRMFSLNLFHTQGGRAYTHDELATLLHETGFTDVRQHLLRGSDTDHLVTAVLAG